MSSQQTIPQTDKKRRINTSGGTAQKRLHPFVCSLQHQMQTEPGAEPFEQ